MSLGRMIVATIVFAHSLFSTAQTTAAPEQNDTISKLRAGFHQPPQQARLRCYWWWLNGNTDKPTILRDLEEMKTKGFGGVILVDAGGASQNGNSTVPAGPKFGSPAWTDLYVYALREADRLGLEITLNIQSGWDLGGPTVTVQDAAKLLTFASVDVQGGPAQDVRLPAPPSMNGFYRDIAVLAYPLHHGAGPVSGHGPYGRSLLLRSAASEFGMSMEGTPFLLDDGASTAFRSDPKYADASVDEVRVLPLGSDGSVHAQLPAGAWEILRIGYTDSGAKVSTSSDTWKGLAIDALSSRAFDDYWDQNVKPLLVAAKPYSSLKYLATDSWETGGMNWTEGFREEFQKSRGYDPVPYLPIVAGRIIGDPSISTRFLTDLRRTVADLIVKNYYDRFAARAAEFGLGVQAESGGPHVAPLDALETFRKSAVPQTEFWSQSGHRPEDKGRYFVKEASSAADIYGQPYVAAEGETSIGPQWSESLSADLKPSFDMAVTEGLNRLVWHEFTSSPASAGIPGQEYFAGTHLNPNVTWWNVGGPFFDYLNRVQFMMQQGHAVHDVLYFYGGQAPNFVRLKADDPAHALPGYDYDVTDEDALLRTIRIDGPELVGPSLAGTGGVHWRVLVLPSTRRVSLAVLQFVQRYLEAGGSVVSLPPTSAIGNVPQAEKAKFDQLALQIWSSCQDGAHSYARGTVYCTADAHAALRQKKIVPDVELASGDVRIAPVSSNAIDWAHRQVDGESIYFVRSAYGEQKHFSLYLRAQGEAELWDPVAGRVYRATAEAAGDRTRVDLQLPAFGSVFLVFPAKSSAAPAPVKVREEKAEGTWQLKVPGSEPISLDEPRLWNEIQAFRYFSGTATYKAKLATPHLDPGETACLHFPQIHAVANFHADDRDTSIVWTYPYEYCLRDLKGSSITLSIDVTNLWHNRLVGDEEHPEGRTTHTNIVLPSGDRTLLPSGLTGPAEWWIYK
ncbi:glycosyl hydrolase [Silvibacterium sp.]|uniref:glycosyl hydrolase n=1 Tax=Silvibacterium sp. TaxID=1964179 RepID=UPI0039E685CE